MFCPWEPSARKTTVQNHSLFHVKFFYGKKVQILINSVCNFLFVNESPAVTCYVVSLPCKRLFPASILKHLKALKIQLNNAAVSTLNHNVTFSSLSSIYATQFGNKRETLKPRIHRSEGEKNMPDFSFTRTSFVTCHEEFRFQFCEYLLLPFQMKVL